MIRHARSLVPVLAVLAASCGDTTTPGVSQLNLDRPVDIAFACYGGLRITRGNPASITDDIRSTAQPLAACNIRSGPHETIEPVPVPSGQEDLTMMGGAPIANAAWFGFILQSGTGTVAIAQWATKPSSAFAGGAGGDVQMLDADPLTPGKNGISVGEDPIAIVTDKVGCYEVIANAGSCDLSALDITTALDTDPDVRVNRIDVVNATGQKVRAKPAAMVGEPAGGVIGETCSATPQGLVYIAYPSCHLVAAVDTGTGTIVAGIDYSTGTPTMTGGNVSCPAECGGGGTLTTGIRPTALDLELDPRTDARKLVIGSENSRSITVVELGSDSLPVSLRQVAFEDPTGTLGVTSIALSPEIGMGGSSGSINDDIAVGGQFQFVYAVATDDTVRVADVLSLNRECDAQVDPRMIDKENIVSVLSCFKVGDPATPRRRPGARGPGIELPGDALPLSVDTFKAEEIVQDMRLQQPTKLVGYFGVISATNGGSFVFNVDDDDYADFEQPLAPLDVWMPLAVAHQIRDGLPERNLTNRATEDVDGRPVEKTFCNYTGPDPDSQAGNSGGPRSTAAPTRNVPTGFVAPEKVQELPYIRQVLCTGEDTTKAVSELSFDASDAVRDLTYPDLRTLRDETWTMTWEGSLSLDRSDIAIDGPPVHVGQLFNDGGGFRMSDPSKAFCDVGVEQYDILQLRGCDPALGDGECPLGYTCFVHPNSQINGIGACMLVDEADRLADACKDFLISRRRYTVNRTESGVLTLLPRKHVLQTTPVDGCTDDAQCESLADLAARNATSTQPGVADNTDPHTYVCRTDNDRAPLSGAGQTGKRCIESCAQTSDCTTGNICQGGLCMEGVTPAQACVNAPQRFELRAGEAFTLVGSRTGYVHSTILDPGTGKCTKDPTASPFNVGRIKLTPPACNAAADPRTGLLPDGVTYDANPCALTVDHTENVPAYLPGTCTVGEPATTIQTRQASAIRFHTRGPTLTMVDPTYPGDQTCIRDRLGTLGRIPLVFGGYQVAWRQTGGFQPLLLPITPSFPIKIVRGPQQSVWVIDAGDFLSTSITQASTRGKVFRLEAQALGKVNLLE